MMSFNLMHHTSKKRGLRSIFWPPKMLQHLPYLWKKKTHIVFFVFHLEQLWVLPYKCPGLCQHSVLAGLLYCILFPHELQLYFIFSWTDSLWALRFCEVAKLLWQESQLNLILSCIDFTSVTFEFVTFMESFEAISKALRLNKNLVT